MLETIRHGTFETNSSSCHSVTYTSKENFEAFKKGDLVFQIGSFGVTEDYLIGRGYAHSTKGDEGQDGKILRFNYARDLYVNYMKEKNSRTWRQDTVNLFRWWINKGIRKLDDITVEDFKKAVNSDISFPFMYGYMTYEKWEVGCEGEKSYWEEKDGKIEMHTNWFAG